LVSESAAATDATVERSSGLAAVFASEDDFRAFYERALPRVYGYLVHRCGGDRAVAEELTQQTFIDAVRQAKRFDGRSDPVTWLIAIARHKLADHYRGLASDERRHARLVVREIVASTEDRAWQRTDEREAIVRALGALPALHRAVLVLHYADGLPVREVARQLGRSESGVESLLTRARESFRRSYGEPADD
jgi:RNA polymerase sigma-70 factor (ECF subfamily)